MRCVGMQELNGRQVLRLWSEAAHLRRVRSEKGAALRAKTAAAQLRAAWKEWRAWRCGCRVMRRIYVVTPFACWQQRAADRALAKARLLQAAQVAVPTSPGYHARRYYPYRPSFWCLSCKAAHFIGHTCVRSSYLVMQSSRPTRGALYACGMQVIMFGSVSRAFLCWRRDAEVWFMAMSAP